MNMKRSPSLLAFVVAISLLASPSFAAVKAGAKCTKAGATSTTAGKKYTCVKSGAKLVWNKGVALKPAPKPSVNPVMKPVEPTPNSKPTSQPSGGVETFVPWSSSASGKLISDTAQAKFREWAKSQVSSGSNHKLIVQENFPENRRKAFQLTDTLGSRLFSQFINGNSVTVLGVNDKWVVQQLNENGGVYQKCSENFVNAGLDYCLDGGKTQGYVVIRDAIYDPSELGYDGSALLAHEYFHIVQFQMAGLERKQFTQDGFADTANLFPVWFSEGTANFVGFSVATLALGSTYWESRPAMFRYAPPDPATNRNTLKDYEIRNGPGNYSPTYPYVIGQFAAEYLVASVGFQKMLDIWIDFKKSNNFQLSFEKATGISLTEFYGYFEKVRTNMGLPEVSYKLVCLNNYPISQVPQNPGPCILDSLLDKNGQSQRPSDRLPPPIDRSSNVDGLGCSFGEKDLINSFGTFVCTSLLGGNNLWKKKP
jgi:hypothetical protein